MTLSVFDLFKIGIGPSSSHTVGPMKAAFAFVELLQHEDELDQVAQVSTQLFGSLGLTGQGHGTVKAVVLGLQGNQPHLVNPATADADFEAAERDGRLNLGGTREIQFDLRRDVVMHLRQRLDFHTNGMRFEAQDAAGEVIRSRDYYSIGGGFILDQDEIGKPKLDDIGVLVPYPFNSGDELVALANEHNMRISDLVLANELTTRDETEVRAGVLHIWSVMQECIRAGSTGEGILPGGLRVRRRGAIQREKLEAAGHTNDPLLAMEWVTLAALAVNEENADAQTNAPVQFKPHQAVSLTGSEPLEAVPNIDRDPVKATPGDAVNRREVAPDADVLTSDAARHALPHAADESDGADKADTPDASKLFDASNAPDESNETDEFNAPDDQTARRA